METIIKKIELKLVMQIPENFFVHLCPACHEIRESNKGAMTVRKYSFLLVNSSHNYICELYVLARYGNFVSNIQNFEKNYPDISE